MKGFSKRRLAKERHKQALTVTLEWLNRPGHNLEGVISAMDAVNFAELLLRTFAVEYDFNSIEQCHRCTTFYLKARVNQMACSASCSAVLRQRKYRSVTGSAKIATGGNKESVTMGKDANY